MKTSEPPTHSRILILDFGSQYTQVIARRIRECQVYSKIYHFATPAAKLREEGVVGIILSGGPQSVYAKTAPHPDPAIFELGVPILGICYGEQLLCQQLGGLVEPHGNREFGRAYVDVADDCALFHGVWTNGSREQVWMSHGDRVTRLPPGFRGVGTSEGAPFAAIADDERHFYGVQFHPEVVHTPHGAQLLRNFTHGVVGLSGSWTMAGFRATEIARIRGDG